MLPDDRPLRLRLEEHVERFEVDLCRVEVDGAQHRNFLEVARGETLLLEVRRDHAAVHVVGVLVRLGDEPLPGGLAQLLLVAGLDEPQGRSVQAVPSLLCPRRARRGLLLDKRLTEALRAFAPPVSHPGTAERLH